MRWSDLSRLTILSDNKYECENSTTVQRIVVDSRHGGNPISAQYKIVVMKQTKEELVLINMMITNVEYY